MASVEDLSGEENSEVGSEVLSISQCLASLSLMPYSTEHHNCEPGRQAISEERSTGGPHLDVNRWGGLDEHIMVKIISRLPFRSYVQASSSLSKAWIHTVDSECFKTELQKTSSSWQSYCPVFMNSRRELVGYDGDSKHWYRLPTHSYLKFVMQGWCLRAGAGSLFCWTENSVNNVHAFVTNPLTRSLKKLPDRPVTYDPSFVHIQWEGNTDYKVILGSSTDFEAPHDPFSINVQIFNSTDESWIVEDYISEGTTGFPQVDSESVFMNGVLYVLVYGKNYQPPTQRRFFKMISLDVKKKVWSEIPLRIQAINEDGRPCVRLLIHEIHLFKVCVCGSDLMMIMDCEVSNIGVDVNDDTRDKFSVFKLDVDHGLAIELSRAQNKSLGARYGSRFTRFDRARRRATQSFSTVLAHGDSIYINYSDWEPPLLDVYNVRSRLWHEIPSIPDSSPPFDRMTPFSYQPGLNALLDVGFLS